MRVALIAHYLDESVGHGLDRYSFRLYEGLKSKGIAIEPVSCPPVLLGPVKSFFDFFFFIPLRMLFARGDVFHLLAPQAGIVLPLFRLLRGKKVVSTIHDLTPILYRSRNPGFGLVSIALGHAIRGSDLLLAVSSQTKSDIIRHFAIPENRIIVSPPGVDGRFRPLGRQKNERFTIGYLGGFAAFKDVPFLLRAYAIFERKGIPCRLVLYGKGAQYERCRRLAAELGLKNAEFRGFAPEEKLVEVYNSFDAFVFPSESEGFGLPIVEAQMCRVPVIVRESSHIPEEVTRFCLKARDEGHLAALLEKVGREGFVFTEEHVRHLEGFSWENCIGRTAEAYGRLSG